jgi:amino acid permease
MKRYDLDELWTRLSQEEKDELMGYSADRLMYTSLFCVFLAYSVILVVLLFLSPNPSVPIVHQNFKVNKLLLLALSVTAVVVCYFAARSIILMIVEVFYQRLARRYFGS